MHEEANMMKFAQEVHPHDKSNREGHHSAKVYFNRIFYPGFIRHQSDIVNHALDYGYAVLLSLANRENDVRIFNTVGNSS
jgi:CRISPR-associated protein Cas1